MQKKWLGFLLAIFYFFQVGFGQHHRISSNFIEETGDFSVSFANVRPISKNLVNPIFIEFGMGIIINEKVVLAFRPFLGIGGIGDTVRKGNSILYSGRSATLGVGGTIELGLSVGEFENGISMQYLGGVSGQLFATDPLGISFGLSEEYAFRSLILAQGLQFNMPLKKISSVFSDDFTQFFSKIIFRLQYNRILTSTLPGFNGSLPFVSFSIGLGF